MLLKVRRINFKDILKKIPVYQVPNLRIRNSFVSIDSFFYTYPLIKKLIEKNNLFYSSKETKITRANMVRFNKPLRSSLLVTKKTISKLRYIKNHEPLRRFINEQDFKKL